MAGRMPGRPPAPPENDAGYVVQRLRMELGISRERLGLPVAIELGRLCPSWVTADPALVGAECKPLDSLGITRRELSLVDAGDLDRDELVIRALGRLLHRAKNGRV